MHCAVRRESIVQSRDPCSVRKRVQVRPSPSLRGCHSSSQDRDVPTHESGNTLEKQNNQTGYGRCPREPSRPMHRVSHHTKLRGVATTTTTTPTTRWRCTVASVNYNARAYNDGRRYTTMRPTYIQRARGKRHATMSYISPLSGAREPTPAPHALQDTIPLNAFLHMLKHFHTKRSNIFTPMWIICFLFRQSLSSCFPTSITWFVANAFSSVRKTSESRAKVVSTDRKRNVTILLF